MADPILDALKQKRAALAALPKLTAAQAALGAELDRRIANRESLYPQGPLIKPEAPPPKPPQSEGLPLNYAAGVLGGLATRLGAKIAHELPLPADIAAAFTGDDPGPRREYASGGPRQEQANTQRNLDETLGRTAEWHPRKAMAARAAGTTVRNLPAAAIPGGLPAQIAASPLITAANLGFDAASEGEDALDAADPREHPLPYALGLAGTVAGPAISRMARSGMGTRAAQELGDEASRARLRSTGASAADVRKVYRGKGKAKLDALARGIEDEGFAGKVWGSATPDKIARRAAEAEPAFYRELDAANAAASEAVAGSARPGIKARDIQGFFTQKADELEGLAAKYGDETLNTAAARWRERAKTLMTDVFENRPELPRVPSRGRVFTDSGGFDPGAGGLMTGNQRPAAFPPLPRGAQVRSPTSGTRPSVQEAEDLAHPGIMKPDPQPDDTLQIPVSQGAITKSWDELLAMRQHWDALAKRAYEGGDQTAAQEAREVATYLRRSMAELADALPGAIGHRLREANRKVELISHVDTFADNQRFNVTPGDVLGRDAARGAAAGGAPGAAAAVVATESKGRWPDFTAKRLRAAENRLKTGYAPGGTQRQAIQAATSAVGPSGPATADAIRREIERQRQARENAP